MAPSAIAKLACVVGLSAACLTGCVPTNTNSPPQTGSAGQASAGLMNTEVQTAVDRAQSAAARAREIAARVVDVQLRATRAAELARAKVTAVQALSADRLIAGTITQGRYEAERDAPEPRRLGKIWYSNGGLFEGETRNGCADGAGVTTYSSGNRFEGEHVNCRPSGVGVYVFANGNRYEGEMRNGSRSGLGLTRLNTGDRYEGEYRGDRWNGYGRAVYANGLRYEGEYREGAVTGYGIFYHTDGARYEGEHENNLRQGPGLQILGDGRTLQAVWEKNQIKTMLGATGKPAPAPAPASRPPSTGTSPSSTIQPASVTPRPAPATPAPPAPQATTPSTLSGTGFYVTTAGHVLTNDHVVRDCRAIIVRRPGLPFMPGLLIAKDTSVDLALVKTSVTPEAIAEFRSGTAIRAGDSIVVYGFPLAGALSSAGNLTLGNVTAMAGLRDDQRMLQITAPIQPGNSGGPLLDTSGKVVGVVRSTLDAMKMAGATGGIVPQNVNFAIKTGVVEDFLRANGISPRLGTSTTLLSAADVGEKAQAYTVQVVCQR